VIELAGPPIVSAVCCCADCRRAGAQLEEAPGAPPVLRADGGTAYCLYRKDRVTFVSGGEQLEARRLTPESPTRRVVAGCCGAPMFLDFTRGHWVSVYRDRLGADAPALEMKVQTHGLPPDAAAAGDLPTYAKVPPRFALRLLGSWAAMGFRRPALPW
jgi:hypothetical protein